MRSIADVVLAAIGHGNKFVFCGREVTIKGFAEFLRVKDRIVMD